MKKHSFVISFIFLSILTLLFHQPAYAHGGEPRIEISTDKLNPGGVLDLRGVGFEMEEAITLNLVGSQKEIPFGTVLADTEGIFQLTITLPFDLAEGTYVIRATTDDHSVDSPPLTVWGSSDLGGGEEGPREEEDGLLAPFASAVAGAPTSVPEGASPVNIVSATESESEPRTSMAYLWIVGGMGIILVSGILLRVKR